MLVLILILRDHRLRMVLLLFSMCLQSFSWLIFLRRLRLALISRLRLSVVDPPWI
jgi:hypothetical protein